MAHVVFNKGKNYIASNLLDYVSDTIKVALVTNLYTPDKDAHEFFDDIDNEVVGTGYTAGGQALTTKVITRTDDDDATYFDCDDPSWTSSSITARAAIYYKDTGVAATSPLLLYQDFFADYQSVSQDFDVELGDGWLKIGE
jgi:hypothetical protein